MNKSKKNKIHLTHQLAAFFSRIKHLTKQKTLNYLSRISFKSSSICSFVFLIDFRLISIIFVAINKTIKMAIPTNNNSLRLQKGVLITVYH